MDGVPSRVCVFASRCLVRLSTFGSVLVNKKKKSHKWTAHDVRYPPGRGLKPGMCFRESMLRSTFNFWLSFTEQKKKVTQVDGSSCEIPPLKGYSRGVRVIVSRCLNRLSTFSSVLLNKNKKRHKSMAHYVRYPPGWVLKPSTCYRESVLSVTFNIQFSFTEQK